MDRNWFRQIEQAARLLDSASAAPAWLRAVVRNSLSLADRLARDAPPENRPADHFYPH
jgi:hypothetical protein